MVLPMAEMVGWLRQGVGALIRQAGLRVMELLMEEEVRERVGERSLPDVRRCPRARCFPALPARTKDRNFFPVSTIRLPRLWRLRR
jgi:hypothetical protein